MDNKNNSPESLNLDPTQLPTNNVTQSNILNEASLASANILHTDVNKPSSGLISGGVSASINAPIASVSSSKKNKFSKFIPPFFNEQYPLWSRLVFGLGSLLMLLIAGGLIFYLTYWSKSDVVYGRFQKNVSSVLTNTLYSEVELFNDLKFEAEVSSESQDFKLKVNSSGRLYDSGLEANSDILYDDASINVGVITLNKDSNFELYLKYKGIEQFYKSLLKSRTTSDLATNFSSVVNVLKKYEDKWINVNLFDLIESDENAEQETITKEDYKIVIDAALPIVKDRFIGLDKNNAVIKTSNIRSEDVAGKPAFAYDVEVDNPKFNEMLDELIKAISASKLSQTKKDIVKEQLENQKVDIDTSPGRLDSYSSRYSKTQKYTIWLNKLTGIPVKYADNYSSSINGKLSYSTETVFEISKFTIHNIEAKLTSKNMNYDDLGKEAYKSVFNGDLVLDTKKSIISFGGAYDPDASSTNDKLTYQVKVQKSDVKTAIEAPKDTTKITKLYEELVAAFESQ